MINQTSLLYRMLSRGDEISINQGVLDIRPASQKPVSVSWVKDNRDQLVKEVAVLLERDLLVYLDYSAGGYSSNCYSGITLQFQWLVSCVDGYAIFNADLKRAKSTKSGNKGTPLPKRQFRAGLRSKFVKFWKRSGIKMPPRLSSFHDYMGKLKQRVFIANDLEGEKLDKDSIEPFNITASEISKCYSLIADKNQTNNIQDTDKTQTIYPDKVFTQSCNRAASEGNITTGISNCGTRSSGSTDTSSSIIQYKEGKKPPSDQTNEEWLDDYNKGDLH